jgi:hypothetical protein
MQVFCQTSPADGSPQKYHSRCGGRSGILPAGTKTGGPETSVRLNFRAVCCIWVSRSPVKVGNAACASARKSGWVRSRFVIAGVAWLAAACPYAPTGHLRVPQLIGTIVRRT